MRTHYTLLIGLLLALGGWHQAAAQTETLLLQDPTVHGNTVVFVYADNLYRTTTDGGTAIQLTTAEGFETRPRLSPDGKWLAFTGQYDGNTDVFVVEATGGTPRRLTFHPAADVVEGWSADGRSILFRSARHTTTRGYSQLFTIALTGEALPTQLPLPYGERASFSPDGKQLAYLQIREAWRSWKRYRGGMTDPIRIVDLATLATQEIPGADVNNSYPVWLPTGIFFLSDREGIMNVYHYDPATKAVKRVTGHTDYDCKTLSGNADQLVYQQGGRIHVLNAKTLQSKPLAVQVVNDQVHRRPHWVNATDFVQDYGLSPTGKRLLVAARGEILTAPVEHGDARNLTQTPGGFERDPAWSPDGKHIAYFAVETGGEYRLAIRAHDGTGTVRYLSLDKEPTYYYTPVWSPDSKKIAFTTKGKSGSSFRYIDLATEKITVIDDQILEPLDVGQSFGLNWSHDGKWIAYAKATQNFFAQAYLFEVATGTTRPITDPLAYVNNPVFSTDGKYVFLTASTNSGLALSGLDMSSNQQRVTSAIYAVVLSRKTPSPFRPRSDEEAQPEAEKDTTSQLVIDWEGITQRMVVLEGPQAYFAGLVPVKDALIYGQFDREDGGPFTLYRYDLTKRKRATYAEGVEGYTASADGTKLMLRYPGNRLVVADTDGPVDPSKAAVTSLDPAKIWVDPLQEWAQMYEEVWRVYRDFFYVPNLHGADWKAIGEKYRRFLPHLPHRNDFNDLLADLIGETVIGHAYVGGGDFKTAPSTPCGLLGADFTLDNGYFRIAKIYSGESWNPDLNAPLAQPGLAVSVGDYILAVDGQALRAPTSIFALLQGKAGKQVRLRLNSRPTDEGAREVVVEAVGSEFDLRHFDWVEGRRRYVEQASGGKLGYVYLPNTGYEGYTYFRRYFYSQLDKQGMVIDERFNGGGQVADYITDMLRRRTLNYWVPRTGALYKSPFSATDGPMAMVINENAGSGGDYLPWSFRELGLGKLVGERTWGGLVGIAGSYPLMDNGFITCPSFGILSKDGQWIIENTGVAPDIQVWQDPKLVAQGKDPQLDAAIQVVLDALKANPTPKAPAKPEGPNRVKY